MQDDFIAGYWLCSWMDVYLEAVDEQDPQKRNQAVTNIAKYPSLPVSQKYLSNPEDFDTMITTPARNGDPAMVSEYYDSSCTIYRDNQPAGSTS
ncbi:hypothetical protein [Arthrobacter burdickii]|uniref:Uncharacterized protein n=1 Tax=Arthrobacter burdickii TaxID=3035920 RepID=A0ABT8JZL1_9MICC|nr:hypothetical protein [Arthrobacter burdickii]MDN4609584.1 hypothetical protein [Arthrobacter burdickii]